MEWINVKNKLPEKGITVLLFHLCGYEWENNRESRINVAYISVDSFKDKKWKIDCGCSGYECDPEEIESLFWMPLPNPPENE